jgi:hypothetical protein
MNDGQTYCKPARRSPIGVGEYTPGKGEGESGLGWMQGWL